MDLAPFQFADSIVVARPPEEVYEIVADLTRMGELSPVCTACEWEDATGPVVGAWFTGTNVNGDRQWQTRCRVAVAQPGVEFAFMNHGVVGNDGDIGLIRWGYTFSPVAEGGTQ